MLVKEIGGAENEMGRPTLVDLYEDLECIYMGKVTYSV